MEVIKFILEILVAQISDGHFKLGNLFNGLKVNVNKYEEIITKFQSLKNIGAFIGTDGNLDFDKLSKKIGDLDDCTQSYFNSLNKGKGIINNSSASIKGMSAYLESTGQAFNFASIKATLLNTALNAGIFFAVSWAIQVVTKALDDYIHRLDRAKETLESTESELSSVSEQIEDNTAKIRELEALSTPSITDKEDLEQLRLQNEELRIRQKYLEQQKQDDSKKVAETAKEQYGVKYSHSATREDINKYKELYENPKKSTEPASSYLTGGSNTTSSPYAASQQDSGMLAYSDNLADLIAQYEYFDEQKKKAIQDEDSEAIDKWNKKLEETATKLREDRAEIQEFSDAMSASGESSPALNDALYKLGLIDDTLLTKGQNLVNFINSDSVGKDKEKLVELAESGKLTASVLSSKFKEVDKYLKDNGLTLEDLISIVRTYKEEIESTTTNKFSFTDTISQVQSLSEGLDQLDKIYADILDKESFNWSSILNNNEFKETFGGLGSAYDEFVKTISNSPNDINACQSAFDNLASSYIYTSGALNSLTEDTKASTIAMLEQMGVANAEEVVESRLALQREFLAQTGIDLANATYEEINAFLEESSATDEAKQHLAAFQLQKELLSGITLDTSGDVQNLINLVTACDGACDALTALNRIKRGDTSQFMYGGEENYKALEKLAQKEVEDALEKVKNASTFSTNKINYSGGKATETAKDNIKKASKEAAQSAEQAAKEAQQKIKEYIDAYMNYMDKALDANKITYNQYCNEVSAKLSGMYKDGKISAQDYFSYQEKMLNKQLSFYQSALKGITAILDDEIDKIDDSIDALNKKNDALNEQKDNLDKILSVVNNVYDKEIDKLEEQKDLLQDKIDAINDENDALDLQKRKQEALYALERAQQQRTKKVYIEGQGYVYKTDQTAIRDAQDNLQDIKNEEIIDKLEKEQEVLDKSIEILQHYKDLWNEISDAYDVKLNEQLAIALWGKNYEGFILQNREQDIEDFKNNYIHIQEQIDDNTSMIESFEEKKDYYNQLKEQWNSITTAYEDSMNRQAAAQLLGANFEKDVLSGRLDVMNNFRNQYIGLQQAIADAAWKSANEQIAAINAVKAAEASRTPTSGGGSGSVGDSNGSVSSGSSTLYYVVDRNGYVLSPGFKTSGEASSKIGSYGGSGISTTYKKKPASGGGNKGGSMQLYGTGTKSAKSGTHIVAENGDEIIRKNDGSMVVAEGKQPFNFEGGETVFNSSETSELLNNIGELKPLDINSIQNENFKRLLLMSQKLEPQILARNFYTPQFNRNLQMKSQQPVVIQQDINLTLPNVTNDSGYERIKKELKQMQIDSYQLAHMR